MTIFMGPTKGQDSAYWDSLILKLIRVASLISLGLPDGTIPSEEECA